MSLVGQYAPKVFTSPVNSGGALDANIVRGNDNVIRAAFAAHDADPTIHVQSSTLAARPAAGVPGRLWITEDAGAYEFWYDDGTAWQGLSVTNALTATKLQTARTLWGQSFDGTANVTGSLSSVTDIGMTGALSGASTVSATTLTGTLSTGLQPNVTSVGTLTAGTWNATAIDNTYIATGLDVGKLTTGTTLPSNVVSSSLTSVGTIASGTWQGTAIANSYIATGLDVGKLTSGTTLPSNVVSSSLTSVGTLANLTVTNPITGSVTGSSGSTTGNAATATALQTARNINGVSFDGTANITVAAAAGTLTGSTLAAGVTASSLTSLGVLTGLEASVAATGAVKFSTTTSGTAASVDVLRLRTKTSGDMANGFGPSIDFIIEDNANVENTIASLSVIRDQGDTLGTFVFTNDAGSNVRVTRQGNFLVGTATQIVSSTVDGFVAFDTGRMAAYISGGVPGTFNRNTNDGTLISLRQADVEEGTISVSGATVSYNAFAGSHWSQLLDGGRQEILRGTVMESLDELCVWPGEANERLPKAKVSDTVASPNVYGVFMDWDNDWTDTNDMYVTALGAFICRINANVTVARGSLLESNGDGTARVQADMVIRSSTIGKVTSTVKTHEYEDGTYCVPVVLYCG